MTNLAEIADKLEHFSPRKGLGRRDGRRSAVVMLLHGASDPAILMIERAQRHGDPWSGHMAFPGGRMDDSDDHSYAAAIRECEEEIGLNLHEHGHYLGRLSDLTTHIRQGIHGMWVTPFVFELKELPPLSPNYEVADIVWVPLGYLADANNRDAMRWQRDGLDIELPCSDFQGKRIWGLSLGMLDELLKVAGMADFPQP